MQHELMKRQNVSEQLKRTVFCESPQRLYGFTVGPADVK